MVVYVSALVFNGYCIVVLARPSYFLVGALPTTANRILFSEKV